MEEKEYKLLVIEKARELFKVYGYKKTTMEDIAKACHKSKGLIYHHYNSKEEIFRIIVNNEINQLLYNLKKIVDDKIPLKDKFTCFFITTNSWLNDRTNMYHKIVIEIFDYIDVIRDIIENLFHEITIFLKKILIEGIEEKDFILTDVESTSLSILQMMLGFMSSPLRQILSLNINTAMDINKFIDIIYYGLKER